MNKSVNFIIGAAVGALAGLAVHYLLGPSDSVSDDPGQGDEAPYRSRLDAALDAGRQAAADREAELRANFDSAKGLDSSGFN